MPMESCCSLAVAIPPCPVHRACTLFVCPLKYTGAPRQGEYLGHGRGGGEGTGLTEGLAHLLDRFRAAAGTAVRALRLELTLLLVFYLQVCCCA
jgi:hypothetical protein